MIEKKTMGYMRQKSTNICITGMNEVVKKDKGTENLINEIIA